MLRTVFKVVLVMFFTIWSLVASSLSPSGDSLRFKILLTAKMLNDIHLNECLINSLDITSNRLILLSTSNQFYLLGWGGIVPLGKNVTGIISSFAFTPDSLLMTIRNNELCSIDSLGNLSKLFKLPNPSMGISAGKYVMYVYDRNTEQKQSALYLIAKGGKYLKVFNVPGPISSVAETNNSILFATGNALFRFTPANKELKTIAVLSKNKKIASIAVEPSGNVIYFSTDSVLYALKDSSVVIITDKYAGTLRYYNGGLMIFNPERKVLIRMEGIEDKIIPKIPSNEPAKN